jgi:hypothetical protein
VPYHLSLKFREWGKNREMPKKLREEREKS